MKRLAKQIYAARKDGRLPPVFRPKDVAKACPGWSKQTYGAFLPKHRSGNPGGQTELFEKVARGLYRIISEKEKKFVFKAELVQEDDGRWSSWIDKLPGCAAWGYSEEEALTALNDAALAYIGDMLDAGEELPQTGVDVVDPQVATVRI